MGVGDGEGVGFLIVFSSYCNCGNVWGPKLGACLYERVVRVRTRHGRSCRAKVTASNK